MLNGEAKSKFHPNKCPYTHEIGSNEEFELDNSKNFMDIA